MAQIRKKPRTFILTSSPLGDTFPQLGFARSR
jgi:hypothetical protein